VDIVYLDFSKAFDIAFLKILVDKVLMYGLGEPPDGLKTG